MAGITLHALLLVLAIDAPAATISGTVRDAASGAPIAGVVVLLADLERGTLTDGLGRYRIVDVPPGPQHVTFRRAGYTARSLHALMPRAGELEIHVTLEPDPIPLAALSVTRPPAVRGLESDEDTPYPDRGVSAAAIRLHPLLAEPDGLEALAGGEVVLAAEAPTGVHLRGGASDQTAYLIDGIPVLNPYHTAGVFSGWNPDALAAVRLSASAPSPGLPDALSGVVEAETRASSDRHRIRGSTSTTQLRIAADGPLADAGYLLSWRTGLPNRFAPTDESSYFGGETGDLLAKIGAPLASGTVELLAYEAENELGVAAGTDGGPLHHRFEWRSRSLGARWTAPAPIGRLQVTAWRAATDALASWRDEQAPLELRSGRTDWGAVVAVASGPERTRSRIGLRVEHITTHYDVETSADAGGLRQAASTPSAVLFAERRQPLGDAVAAELAAGAVVAAGRAYLTPRAQLGWQPAAAWSWTASYARTVQLAQSLRNAESVVGYVFPAELYVAATRREVPVAHGQQLVLALDWRGVPGVRVAGQAYGRVMRDLVLPAHGDGSPFATEAWQIGRASALGGALEASASGARYDATASYGIQHVRYRAGSIEYTPVHGTSHLVDAGITAFPTPTFGLRIALSGGVGRRATAVGNGFEWEACNLLDQGCEFAGSPIAEGDPGATRLPAYLRLDLGVRKHWHLQLGPRDVAIGAFATVTNVTARTNVLTYATDPETGERSAVTMRPRAPLVFGVDWRF